MKKIILLIALVLLLNGCALVPAKDDKDVLYLNLIDSLNLRDKNGFETNSEIFDLTFELNEIENGYRYYVTLDNPKYAMYGVSILAIEEGEDYSDKMAANAGIFEDDDYYLVPGQAEPSKGYVKGISISGLSNSLEEKPKLKVIVQWHSSKQEIRQLFFYHDFNEIGD